MAKGSLVALALLAAVVLMARSGLATIDCNKARSELIPCAPYLTGNAPDPIPICCKGVEYIKENSATKADKQSTCQCLKDTAAEIPNLKDSAAQELANKCKVPIDIIISRTVDCNNI